MNFFRLPSSLYLVLGFVALCYAQVCSFDFVNRDDDAHILEDSLITSQFASKPLSEYILTPSRGYPAFTSTIAHHIIYQSFGYQPLPFHLLNIFLHLIVVAMVFALGLRVGFEGKFAALLALFFGIHPVTVESVVWVSSTKSLMASIFFLAVILEFFSVNRKLWRLFLWLILGALSKPSIIFVIPLIALIDFGGGQKLTSRDRRIFYSVSILISMLLIFYSAQSQASIGALKENPIPLIWLREIWYAIGYQLRLAFVSKLPSPVHIPSSRPPGFEFATDLFPVLFILALVVLSRGFRSIQPRLLFWFGIIAIPLAQGVNLIPQNRYLGDTFSYLSAVGVCGLIVEAIMYLNLHIGKNLSRALAGILVLCFSLLTLDASLDWRNGKELWESVERRYPDSPEVCRLVGHALLKDKKYQYALQKYDDCQSRFPNLDLKAYRDRAIQQMNK